MYVLMNYQCPKAVFDSKEQLFEYARAYSARYGSESTGYPQWSYQKIKKNPIAEEFDKPLKVGWKENYVTHYFDVKIT